MNINALIEVNEDTVIEESGCESVEGAIDNELNWISQSGMSVVSWEEAKKPSLKYPTLNLGHLLCLPAKKRNEYVGLTYFPGSEEAYDCCTEDIAICGDFEDGFIEEESLIDYVMGYSGIIVGEICDTEEPNLPNSIELIQDDVTYLVDYIMSNAACDEECEHLNFNTLRLKED